MVKDAPPLTDEDLHLFEQDAHARKAEKEPRAYGPAMQVIRLVAEVRRLREIEATIRDVYLLGRSGVSGDEVIATVAPVLAKLGVDVSGGIGFAVRSDAWMARAADEIREHVGEWNGPYEPDAENLNGIVGGIASILRKHRDAK